ncbi:MAG: FAD-binding protein [Burkholderiales bacterium]|nr:MAG: FAD-binding protein [Burkholderiales bacterium]
MSEPNIERDVVVVGAGGAGCLAALRLAAGGRTVALLDRGTEAPSLTAICGGLIPGVDTEFQRALGVEDSVQRFVHDVMAKNGGRADVALVRAVAQALGRTIAFMTGPLKIPLHLYTAILHPGLSVPRLHGTPAESGAELQSMLRARVAGTDAITDLGDAFAERLLTDGDGAAIGVAGVQGGEPLRVTASAVVIATGGFGANREMLARFIPDMVDAEHVGSPLSTGELIEDAMRLGADAAWMSGYQGHCHVNPGGRTHLGGSLPRLGAIMVNRLGRRFGAEDGGYSEFALEVLRQPGGLAIGIFDDEMARDVQSLGVFREAVEAGEVRHADSVAALASLFGLDGDVLADEIARYNGFVERGVDEDWGRRIMPRRLEPPLNGAWVTGALAHTQGGLRTDVNARVLAARDGMPMPGLYAIGGAAACFSGDGPAGYLSGNGLAHAFGTAMLAAEAIAGEDGGSR